MIAALIVAEIALRFLGLGDPQLSILDDAIEYYPRPGLYKQLGSNVHINRTFMRSAEVKPKNKQRRIVLLGDSIVHGTFRLNQEELVSTALQKRMSRLENKEIEVLNVAAVSWGPVNQAAFLKRFGTFGADQVVWILSDHDLWDVPVDGYAGLLPTRRPILALEDAMWIARRKFVERYALDFPSGAEEKTLKAIDSVLSMLHQQKIPVVIAVHLLPKELNGAIEPGTAKLRDHFTRRGVVVLSLKEPLDNAQSHGGAYADHIHLNSRGAKSVGTWLAEQLIKLNEVQQRR